MELSSVDPESKSVKQKWFIFLGYLTNYHMSTCLFSAFVFSLSSHALTKANLFSVTTLASIASGETIKKILPIS